MCVKSLSWDGAVVLLFTGLRSAGSGPASPTVPTDTANLFLESRSELSKLNPWALLETQRNLELQMWCQRYLWTCLSWGKASCLMWPLQDASFCFLLLWLEGTDPGGEVLLWGHPVLQWEALGGQGTLCSVALAAFTLLIPRGIPSCRAQCMVNTGLACSKTVATVR